MPVTERRGITNRHRSRTEEAQTGTAAILERTNKFKFFEFKAVNHNHFFIPEDHVFSPR
jgi:hypothetical protein